MRPVAAVLTAFLLAPLAACNAGSDTSSLPAESAGPPLDIPRLAAGEKCPVSAEHRLSPDYGTGLGQGPVYPVGMPAGVLEFIYPTVETQTWYPSDWGGQKVLWAAEPKYEGPILVRGGRIDAPGRLGFWDGHDPVWALRFPAKETSGAWRGFPTYTRLEAPGCYAYQIDGDGFRTIVVFEARIGG